MAFFRITLLTLIVLCSCDYSEPKPASREELIAGTDRFGKTYQINIRASGGMSLKPIEEP